MIDVDLGVLDIFFLGFFLGIGVFIREIQSPSISRRLGATYVTVLI
mgnify:CR=1 FL=1